MGEAEQAALLGELATVRGASGASAIGDSRSDFGSSVEENGVKEIRTWLKGVRDSGYVIPNWSCCIWGLKNRALYVPVRFCILCMYFADKFCLFQ